MKNYFRVNEFRNEVTALFEKGIQRGAYVGFETLDDYYTCKLGTTTYIYGAPFSGKTEFWFDVLITLSELYGWKHAIYSPESGTRAEIIGELISKKARKPFYKQFANCINESEFYREIDWVGEYFYVIDPETDITVEQFYESVEGIERDFDVKIQTTTCDPFNELKHNLKEDEGRQDLYIENKLGMIRRNAIKTGRHNAVITHVGQQELIKATTTEGKDVWFYPPPTPQKIAGGQAWFRKAMNLILVWRPPAGIADRVTNQLYKENEVHIIIQKYKPKGVGKRGTVVLYYDIHSNRYFEEYDGKRRYAKSKELNRPQQLAEYEF